MSFLKKILNSFLNNYSKPFKGVLSIMRYCKKKVVILAMCVVIYITLSLYTLYTFLSLVDYIHEYLYAAVVRDGAFFFVQAIAGLYIFIDLTTPMALIILVFTLAFSLWLSSVFFVFTFFNIVESYDKNGFKESLTKTLFVSMVLLLTSIILTYLFKNSSSLDGSIGVLFLYSSMSILACLYFLRRD